MTDKLKHFIACGAISIVTAIVILLIGWTHNGWEWAVPFATGSLAAVAKEIIWDKWMGKGTPDYYDFFAGLIGAFAASFAWIIVLTIFKVI